MNEIFYQNYEHFLIDDFIPSSVEFEKLWESGKISIDKQLKHIELVNNQDIFLLGHKMSKDTPLHTHNFYEIIFILNGLVENSTKKNSFYMGSGDICLMNLSSSHSLKCIDSEAVVLNIGIAANEMEGGTFTNLFHSDTFLGNFFREKDNLEYLYIPNNGINNLSDLIQIILITHARKTPGIPFLLASQILQLFAELLEINEYSYIGIDKNIMEILNYIKKNCSTTSLSDVAKQFSYSESYLSKLIRKHTGRQLNKIITGNKMEEASLLLINTVLPVNDIANKVGYQSYSHFHKTFKNWHKRTPNEYRLQFEKRLSKS